MKIVRTLIFVVAVFSLLFQGVGAPLAFAATQGESPTAISMPDHAHSEAHHHGHHAVQEEFAEAASDFCHDGTNPFCGDCICHTLSTFHIPFQLAPQEIHNTHLAPLREVQPRIFVSVNPRPPQAS